MSTSNTSGRVGSSGAVVLSGAKGAVISFTKGLASEVARDGINVHCVAPGLVDTPLLAEIAEGHEKLIAAIVRSIPLGRTGVPDEIPPPSAFRVARRRLHHGPDPERQRWPDHALRRRGGRSILKSP